MTGIFDYDVKLILSLTIVSVQPVSALYVNALVNPDLGWWVAALENLIREGAVEAFFFDFGTSSNDESESLSDI